MAAWKEVNKTTGGTQEGAAANNAVKVLLVEDNSGDVLLMREMLGEPRSAKFVMSSASRLSEAMKAAEEDLPDIVLLDLGLPDSSGLKTLEGMTGRFSKLPIIVLTGLTDMPAALMPGIS